MRLLTSVLLVCGAVGSAWAVRAPQREAATGRLPVARSGGLRLPTTDFTHLRSALLAKAAPRRDAKLLKAETPIPPRWDSREHGWVTSVKRQGGYGTCWAFSTMASLETAFLVATQGTVTNDFSENHLATHDVGFAADFRTGGNNQMAAALLTSWRDPLLESEDPYPNPNSRTSAPPQCHVQDIVWLPERYCPDLYLGRSYAVDAAADNQTVDAAYKRAIMKYGAVSIGYYHAWNSYNTRTAAHCYSDVSYVENGGDGGHAVTMIGWDDDYPVENFVVGKRPKGKGAFLVKNSWGNSSDTTNGCTWISYYDELLNYMPGAAYPVPEKIDNYGRIYEYDPCGQVATWNVCDTDAEQAAGNVTNWCANVFTATASGLIEAVGFYAMSADTAYRLRVYRGCMSSPSDGELMVEQAGAVSEAGFTTVRLEVPVPIGMSATKFSVVLQLTCPGYDYPLPVECTLADSEGPWCTCTANAGESYMSKDGTVWRDFHDYDPSGNFCIKAYTRYGSDGEVQPLIMASSPAEKSLSGRVGGPQRFSVTAKAAEEGEELSYEWRVNGVPADCCCAEFDFVPEFAQRGNCVVECVVQSGVSADVCKWTVAVNAELHVACGGSANPDGSVERPFASVSDACVAAIEGDTVLVGSGVYRGTLEGPSVTIEIRSTGGPDVTVLDAEGAGRCFLASQNPDVCLSGFTLRNGSMGYGGGVYGGIITNCVISNCLATVGGGTYGALLCDCRIVCCGADSDGGGIADSFAERCVLSGCLTAFGGGASGSELENCLVVGNRAEAYRTRWSWDGGAGGGAYNCHLFNCTVAGNSAALFGGGAYLDSGCVAVNTIVATNMCDLGGANGNDIFVNGRCDMVCTISDQDVKFVDAANGDWRLSARSPCIDAGSNAFVYVERDLDGTNRIVGARVDLGCYEYCRTVPGWSTPDVTPDATAAEEAAAVSAAMTATGFSPTKANVLSDVAQYTAFSDWVAGRGLTVAAVNDSPTAFVSAALDAPELLKLSGEDVRVTEFMPTGDGMSWKVKLALEAYDPARVNPALLKAAVGIVGAETPSGDYSAAGLNLVVTPAADGIDVNVTPPAGKNTYFMRSVVR